MTIKKNMSVEVCWRLKYKNILNDVVFDNLNLKEFKEYLFVII